MRVAVGVGGQLAARDVVLAGTDQIELLEREVGRLQRRVLLAVARRTGDRTRRVEQRADELRRLLEVVDRLAVAAEPGEEPGDPTPARRVAAQRSADPDPRAAAARPDPAIGGSGRAGA